MRAAGMGSFKERLGAWLVPDEPRDLAGRRTIKIGLRSAHVLCAAVLLGAYVFSVDPTRSEAWLHATMISGLLILLLDLHESAAFLLQVRGLVVLVKLALLAALPWMGDSAPWVLGGIVMVSVLSSHAPGRVRYFLLVGRARVAGPRSKG